MKIDNLGIKACGGTMALLDIGKHGIEVDYMLNDEKLSFTPEQMKTAYEVVHAIYYSNDVHFMEKEK